ncbi:MAG TPA: sigma-70 family RNA polymerase sigma factor [Streptosporangiaceae bacterium]|jgi:RNA polymerase sigma factor (sigma-70 family)
MSDFDPAAALAAAADGDHLAWTSIVSTYSGLIWTVARAYRLSTADSADVFQGTWLRLVEHLRDIREPARLGGWLATTARREALQLLRRTGRDVPVDDMSETAQGVSPTADEELLKTEDQKTLWSAFGQLSDNCQRLLRLLFAEPPALYADISTGLGIPLGSIGPTRSRCLASLETRLSRTMVD